MRERMMPPVVIGGAVGCLAGWVLVMIGPFENKLVLSLLVPAAYVMGFLLRQEYSRGVRAVDRLRDTTLPEYKRREFAAIILSDWRGISVSEAENLISHLESIDVQGRAPGEIACMAVTRNERK